MKKFVETQNVNRCIPSKKSDWAIENLPTTSERALNIINNILNFFKSRTILRFYRETEMLLAQMSSLI